MTSRNNLVSAFLITITPVLAQSPSWQDPSKHTVQMVEVEPSVQLEVLEWSAPGRPVVLLTGSGNTAHVYDDFVPKLADCCHVYAITRRGFGHSSHPQTGYDDQRLADDVLQVINALHIPKPVLVGHSMAGAELTTLGRQHSDRIAGLVYLDAGADPADFPWSDPDYRAAVQKTASLSPPKPAPSIADRNRSYQAYKEWQIATSGNAFCEAEVRNMYDFHPDGSIGPYRTPQRVRDAIDAGSKKRDYSGIHVPALSIFATPIPVKDRPPNPNPEYQKAADTEYNLLMPFIHRYEQSVRTAVPAARILEWPGADHYLFIAQEPRVLRELHDFIAVLP